MSSFFTMCSATTTYLTLCARFLCPLKSHYTKKNACHSPGLQQRVWGWIGWIEMRADRRMTSSFKSSQYLGSRFLWLRCDPLFNSLRPNFPQGPCLGGSTAWFDLGDSKADKGTFYVQVRQGQQIPRFQPATSLDSVPTLEGPRAGEKASTQIYSVTWHRPLPEEVDLASSSCYGSGSFWGEHFFESAFS